MSIISDVIESTRAIIQGMSVTLSYIPKQKQTVEYPDEPVTVQPRYRGQHLLHVDEIGREKCVACFLCAAACPSECIYIEAADDPRPAEVIHQIMSQRSGTVTKTCREISTHGSQKNARRLKRRRAQDNHPAGDVIPTLVGAIDKHNSLSVIRPVQLNPSDHAVGAKGQPFMRSVKQHRSEA